MAYKVTLSYHQQTGFTCGYDYGNQCALKAVAIHPDLLHHLILLVRRLNLLSSDVLPYRSTQDELPVQPLPVSTLCFGASQCSMT